MKRKPVRNERPESRREALASWRESKLLKQDYAVIAPAYYHEFIKAQQQGYKLKISPEQSWKLMLRQYMLCPFSNKLLIPDSALFKRDGNAMLQRKDSRKGYSYNNLQWICKSFAA